MKIPESPPSLISYLKGKDPKFLIELLHRPHSAEVDKQYLPWDDLRHRAPPDGLTADDWWFIIARARDATALVLPLRERGELYFRLTNPDSVRRLVYTIDRDASGRIELPEPVLSPATRDRYIMSSLMEEAIRSSQLEGAATTRQVAKEMIRSGREPRDHGERMIMNNYRAMEWISERSAEAITPEAILALHRILTVDTLDDPTAVGRLRRADEPIYVEDRDDGGILHIPPPAGELPDRLALLCQFAAGAIPEGFVHPVARAIVLHFWLAYDHPFVDGNGRTARALFYWQMLRESYWVIEFVSISRLLRLHPGRYSRAFLHTEAELDITHFVIHQLKLLRQAIDDVFVYVGRKTDEVRDLESRLRDEANLNHRQLALLARLLRQPDDRYTIEQHQRSHGVVYQTARQDLLDLEALGWLTKRKVGRTFVFHPIKDLERKIAGPTRRRPPP